MTTETTVVELEFTFEEGEYFLVRASEQAECEFELEMVVPRSDGSALEFFTVRGADPDGILELLKRARDVSEVRLLDRREDEGLFELVTDGHLAKALADEGTLVKRITATAGRGRLTAEVPPHVAVGPAIEGFLAENPHAELVARRQTDRRAPALTRPQLVTELLGGLTEKQLRTLRLAHANEYYEWPRGTSATELADRLDIATPTFTHHLRVAERKILDALFE